MRFGLTNAPATSMKMMNEVFRDCLDQFVIIYLDDILVFSNTWQEHLQHLEHVLLTLRQHQLLAGLSKCSFAQQSISYLGFIIDKSEVTVDPAKVEVLQKWPSASTPTDSSSFLGPANFYRKFIPHYSDIAAPLHQSTRLSTPLRWTDIHTTAFNTLKHRVCTAPVSVLPDTSQPFEIETDASQFAPGAVLEQNGHPVAYHSEGRQTELLYI